MPSHDVSNTSPPPKLRGHGGSGHRKTEEPEVLGTGAKLSSSHGRTAAHMNTERESSRADPAPEELWTDDAFRKTGSQFSLRVWLLAGQLCPVDGPTPRKIWAAQTELYGLLKLTKTTEHTQVDEQGEVGGSGKSRGDKYDQN